MWILEAFRSTLEKDIIALGLYVGSISWETGRSYSVIGHLSGLFLSVCSHFPLQSLYIWGNLGDRTLLFQLLVFHLKRIWCPLAVDAILPLHEEESNMNTFKQTADEGLTRARFGIWHSAAEQEKSDSLMLVATVTGKFPREPFKFMNLQSPSIFI